MPSKRVVWVVCVLLSLAVSLSVRASPSFYVRVVVFRDYRQPPLIKFYTPDKKHLQWEFRSRWLSSISDCQKSDLSIRPMDIHGGRFIQIDDTVGPLTDVEQSQIKQFLQSEFDKAEWYFGQTTTSFLLNKVHKKYIDLEAFSAHYVLSINEEGSESDPSDTLQLIDNHGNQWTFPVKERSGFPEARQDAEVHRLEDARHYVSLLHKEGFPLDSNAPDYIVPLKRLARSADVTTDWPDNSTNTTSNENKGGLSAKTGIYIMATIAAVYGGLTGLFCILTGAVCWKNHQLKKDAGRKKLQGSDLRVQGSPIDGGAGEGGEGCAGVGAEVIPLRVVDPTKDKVEDVNTEIVETVDYEKETVLDEVNQEHDSGKEEERLLGD